MKTILVATDYSDSAESALKYAALIASFTKAEVAIFNNYSIDIHALNGLIGANAMAQSIKENQHRLAEYAAKLSIKYNRPLASYALTGMTCNDLQELVEKVGADLIVMGMSKDPHTYHLSGITSNTIIDNCNVPVLVVPEKTSLKMPEKVLYACDYQKVPNDEHLRAIKEIATVFGSELQVFHVYKTDEMDETALVSKEEIENRIEKTLGTLDHTYKATKSKHLLEALEDGIREFNADMLVMSPHKYDFWSSLFHKSKTREMVLKSRIPVLSVPS